MDYLSFFNQFSPIDQASIDALLSKCIPKSYAKGEYIIMEGQTQRELLLVEQGVQMSYFNNNGKQHIIAFTYPPSLCAIPESFLFQTPSKYNLQTLSSSTFQAISFQNLNALFDQYHALERLFRKMTELLLIGVLNRHLELHSLTIEQRFKLFAQRSAHLFQLIPHKYIANYLHIDPTNFSKLFNSVKI